MFADRRSIMTNANPSSVDRFADLKQLYAEAIATPEFQAAFGDPITLSIVSAGDEPTDLDMPEPFAAQAECGGVIAAIFDLRSEEHTSELKSLMRTSYAVFCLKKKNTDIHHTAG